MMEANDFNGFLMPTSFLRRWPYDDLIPSLLYFDRVTFLMDDIEGRYVSDDPRHQIATEPPVRLRSPDELVGVPDGDVVDGLLAEQHRYYWPLRDLMRENVIVITAMDLSWPAPEEANELAALAEAAADARHPNHRAALDYQTASATYFDMMGGSPPDLGIEKKGQAVYRWIADALRRERAGWQRVMLHPSAFIAFQKALELFPGLYAMHVKRRFDHESGPATSEALLAVRVTADLLQARLPTYALQDDPAALSEILEVRQRRRSELEAFRTSMATAASELQLAQADPDELLLRISRYVRRVRPVFDDVTRALSDRWRVPKLVLRKTGGVLAAGLCVGIGGTLGTMLAGPEGTLAGTAAGAAANEAVRRFVVEAVGAGAKDSVETIAADTGKAAKAAILGGEKRVDASLAFLFHADRALKRRR